MGEPLFREGQHRRILIDCNQRATRLNVFPKQRGMSAGAGRGVHDDVPWPRIEPAYYFSRQYGNVRQDNPIRKKPADLLMTTKKAWEQGGRPYSHAMEKEPQAECGWNSWGCRQTLTDWGILAKFRSMTSTQATDLRQPQVGVSERFSWIMVEKPDPRILAM